MNNCFFPGENKSSDGASSERKQGNKCKNVYWKQNKFQLNILLGKVILNLLKLYKNISCGISMKLLVHTQYAAIIYDVINSSLKYKAIIIFKK